MKPPQTADLTSGQTSLDGRIEAIEQRIAALDADRETKQRWYRQLPVVVPLAVSVVALILSLTTTYLGESRIARQEKHDARVELRGLIQRLGALPREDIELREQYANDQQTGASIRDAVATENVVLIDQAASLMESDIAEEISGGEYYAVAVALFNAGLLADSEPFLLDGSAAEEVIGQRS